MLQCQAFAGRLHAPEQELLFHLYENVFGPGRLEELSRKWTERMHAPCLTLIGKVGESPAGFKVGYALDDNLFYSWLGGVLPAFRRLGVAQMLLDYQHQWCREQGFRVIRTHTLNQWKDMLLLNLRNGFDIVGTFTDERGLLKIVLEKQLI